MRVFNENLFVYKLNLGKLSFFSKNVETLCQAILRIVISIIYHRILTRKSNKGLSWHNYNKSPTGLRSIQYSFVSSFIMGKKMLKRGKSGQHYFPMVSRFAPLWGKKGQYLLWATTPPRRLLWSLVLGVQKALHQW